MDRKVCVSFCGLVVYILEVSNACYLYFSHAILASSIPILYELRIVVSIKQ